MSSGMVERVTQAILDAESYHGAEPVEEIERIVRAQARAAIAAMREPTEAMSREMNSYACCAGYFEEGWAAAIDEALK